SHCSASSALDAEQCELAVVAEASARPPSEQAERRGSAGQAREVAHERVAGFAPELPFGAPALELPRERRRREEQALSDLGTSHDLAQRGAQSRAIARRRAPAQQLVERIQRRAEEEVSRRPVVESGPEYVAQRASIVPLTARTGASCRRLTPRLHRAG